MTPVLFNIFINSILILISVGQSKAKPQWFPPRRWPGPLGRWYPLMPRYPARMPRLPDIESQSVQWLPQGQGLPMMQNLPKYHPPHPPDGMSMSTDYQCKNGNKRRTNPLLRSVNWPAESCCGKTRVRSEVIGGVRSAPHSFPWLVLILGGCAMTQCGGSLISPRIIVSSFHCGTNFFENPNRICDHSDEQRKAYFGVHVFDNQLIHTYDSIPIIDVRHPRRPAIQDKLESHDMALFILKHPVRYSNKVRPVCLPQQFQDFSRQRAVTVGWGMYAINSTHSREPRQVELNIAPQRAQCKLMSTIVGISSLGLPQDPCSGDSGGPLMSRVGENFILIGSVKGFGFNCMIGTKVSEFGEYNRISHWVDWIR